MALRIASVAYTHYESDPRVKREAEALAARGDEVTVFALRADGYPGRTVEREVNVVRLRLPRYRGGRAWSYLASYVRFLAQVQVPLVAAHARRPFDVVHVHTMPDFMVLAGLVPRLAGARIVLDMHDLMPDLFALKFGAGRGRALGRVAARGLEWVQQAATTLADAVIAVHENQYELLLEAGVPARKLHIVMNAADPRLFPPRKKAPRRKPDAPFRIVYHGTVLHRYGVDLAVEAFALARKEEPALSLEIIGGGDFTSEVRAQAERLGLAPPAFSMTGERRPIEEVAEAIRGAHAGVIPNRDDHVDSVLPTKMLEYIAVGIPVVAARTRCIRRFFGREEAELFEVGDVVGMADAMVRLARDPARCKALVAGGRAWEEAYGWEVNRRHLFRVMDGLT